MFTNIHWSKIERWNSCGTDEVWKRSISLLLSVAFTLFLAEGISKQFMTRASYSANGKETWGHPIVLNSLGYRERKVPQKSQRYRIMVLGDSLTYGAGLAAHERYTDVAGELLGHRYEILNFGVRAGGTDYELQQLRKHIDSVRPDRIVVGFCWNDPQAKNVAYHIDKFKADHRSIAHVLDSVRPIFPGIVNVAYRSVAGDWDKSLDDAYIRGGEQWRRFSQSLAEIKALSDSRNLNAPLFLVLNCGVLPAVAEDYRNPSERLRRMLKYYRQGESEAQRRGFITANVENELAEIGSFDMSVNKYDAHPNARTNRIYAQKLVEMIGVQQ